jgi:hypothetical protein
MYVAWIKRENLQGYLAQIFLKGDAGGVGCAAMANDVVKLDAK